MLSSSRMDYAIVVRTAATPSDFTPQAYNDARVPMNIRATLSTRGFALQRQFAESMLLDAASTLGTPVAEPRDGILVKPLRPVGERRSTIQHTVIALRLGHVSSAHGSCLLACAATFFDAVLRQRKRRRTAHADSGCRCTLTCGNKYCLDD